MLLAAMIGLLDKVDRTRILEDMCRAAEAAETEFHIAQVEDSGEVGCSISYALTGTDSAPRSYAEALGLLDRMRSAVDRKHEPSTDRRILDKLFVAEAEAHGLDISEVHLHEAGRPGAILNMFGIGQAAFRLQKAGSGEFVCSTITTGRGVVVIAHGAVRVPAPACRHLLKGLKHETGKESGERATPTGLAAVSVLISSQTDEIPAKSRRKSIGFGTRRFGDRLGRTILLWT